MKKVNVISLLILSTIMLFVWGCTEQPEIAEPEFVEVVIPDAYKSNSNSITASDEVDDLVLDVLIITTDGKEVTGKVHLIMPDNETLSYMAMTQNIFDETGLTPEYWIEALQTNSHSRISRTKGGCFANCKKIDKGEGKGTCKAECWLDILAKVVGIIAAIVVIVR